MSWNNLKTHCHTANFDTKKEKIVLISETFQNLEIGQLYLDKGLKQIANKLINMQVGIQTEQEKKEIRVQKIFIDFWRMELCSQLKCAGGALLKSHSREEFCSKQGAEM